MTADQLTTFLAGVVVGQALGAGAVSFFRGSRWKSDDEADDALARLDDDGAPIPFPYPHKDRP